MCEHPSAGLGVAVGELGGAQDPEPGAGHYTKKELETLKRVYQEAVAKPVAQFESLSQPAFCSDFGPRHSPWRIGPFVLDASLTFTKTRLFEDPLNIGWKSTVIGNPTLIERDGRLHMFYRGYPRKESQSTRIGHAVFTEPRGGRISRGHRFSIPLSRMRSTRLRTRSCTSTATPTTCSTMRCGRPIRSSPSEFAGATEIGEFLWLRSWPFRGSGALRKEGAGGALFRFEGLVQGGSHTQGSRGTGGEGQREVPDVPE